MRRMMLILVIVSVVCACSGAPTTPVSPSPATPALSPMEVTIHGQIADTASGAVVGTWTQTVPRLPAEITVAAPGYVTRQTWVTTATPRVDLFSERDFDLGFYRQLARNGLGGDLSPLRVLSEAPGIYLQTAGLSSANAAALEAMARHTVAALTGGRFTVSTWDTGGSVRSPQAGWIVVELVDEPSVNSCGRAEVGASAGHIWLNVASFCAHQGYRVHPPLFAHELGHALGFWHVRDDAALMTDLRNTWLSGEITPRERRHAQLAYARTRGNRDVDVDPQRPMPLMTVIVE